MYLFDTDIITNIFKRRPSPALLGKLAEIPKRVQYISTITISEIVYGAMKSNSPDWHLRNLEKILLPAVRIASFNAKAAYLCGQIRADLEKRGMPLGLADLEIAAIALANDFILVTGNTRHFERIIDLRIENWLQMRP